MLCMVIHLHFVYIHFIYIRLHHFVLRVGILKNKRSLLVLCLPMSMPCTSCHYYIVLWYHLL